jgi:uncharacterized protein (TIGR03067 family)
MRLAARVCAGAFPLQPGLWGPYYVGQTEAIFSMFVNEECTVERSLFIAATAVALLLGSAPFAGCLETDPEQAPKKTRQQANHDYWQGTFEMVSMVNDGKVSSQAELKPYKLTVRGSKYHFQKGDYNERGSYKWDVKKEPMEVDIVVDDGPDKDKVWKAIYEANDQRIVLCIHNENKKRPTLIAATTGTGNTTEVWRKVSK